MKAMISIFILLGSCIIPIHFGYARTCYDIKEAEMEPKARDFMKSQRMILPDDEQHFPDIGVKIRWGLVKLEEAPQNHCYVVMSVCDYSGPRKDCRGGIVEVLGLSYTDSSVTLLRFEKVYKVPTKVIAKIGRLFGGNPSFYFAELSGSSALNASKSHIARVPYYGFSGTAVLGSKASFDPTPNRNWRIENGSFDLRRGLTAEVLDVQAFQLDGLDKGGAEGYWKGCLRPPDDKFGRCLVAPWGQAFIIDLKPVK